MAVFHCFGKLRFTYREPCCALYFANVTLLSGKMRGKIHTDLLLASLTLDNEQCHNKNLELGVITVNKPVPKIGEKLFFH